MDLNIPLIELAARISSTGLISMSSIFCCKISSVINQSVKVISVCAECILFQSAEVASMHEPEAIDSVWDKLKNL